MHKKVSLFALLLLFALCLAVSAFAAPVSIGTAAELSALMQNTGGWDKE